MWPGIGVGPWRQVAGTFGPLCSAGRGWKNARRRRPNWGAKISAENYFFIKNPELFGSRTRSTVHKTGYPAHLSMWSTDGRASTFFWRKMGVKFKSSDGSNFPGNARVRPGMGNLDLVLEMGISISRWIFSANIDPLTRTLFLGVNFWKFKIKGPIFGVFYKNGHCFVNRLP